MHNLKGGVSVGFMLLPGPCAYKRQVTYKGLWGDTGLVKIVDTKKSCTTLVYYSPFIPRV